MTPQLRAQIEIRKIRHELRLSLYDFAKLMHVNQFTVASWELGYRNPLSATLLSIWWRGPIPAALVANRVMQVAFSEATNVAS